MVARPVRPTRCIRFGARLAEGRVERSGRGNERREPHRHAPLRRARAVHTATRRASLHRAPTWPGDRDSKAYLNFAKSAFRNGTCAPTPRRRGPLAQRRIVLPVCTRAIRRLGMHAMRGHLSVRAGARSMPHLILRRPPRDIISNWACRLRPHRPTSPRPPRTTTSQPRRPSVCTTPYQDGASVRDREGAG